MFKKAAVFTDIHFGMKSNSKIHNQDCEDYIDWFIDNAKKNGCETGIFCGDWNHNRNSLNLTTMDSGLRSLEKLGSAFDQFFMFAGNHDLYYKDKRDIKSFEFAKHIKGITVVNEILVQDDVAFVPWLVEDEWKKITNIKSKYLFGHFELPSFYMNAMVQMPDHGELKAEHFKHQEYVFSGHFHKRQIKGKIHYIGNAFPHNFADTWDDNRGMMILDRENNKEPEYINWDDAPKYRNINLSQLIDEKNKIMKEKMYLRVNLDLPISYEEATFVKDAFVTEYNCREFTLIPIKSLEELSSDLEIGQFESIDSIVSNEILAIDSENFNKSLLLNIYNNL